MLPSSVTEQNVIWCYRYQLSAGYCSWWKRDVYVTHYWHTSPQFRESL